MSSELAQRSPEWFAVRKDRLTASVFGAAIGINPYMSRQKLFRQKKGIDPKFEGNEMTQWGTDHEDDGINAYECETGVIVQETGFHIHPAFSWLGGSPDGLVGNNGTIEVKCKFNQEPHEEIPGYYMAQIQGVLEITDREYCDFISWSPNQTNIFKVERSENYWLWMLPLLEEFWQYIKDDIEPKRKKKQLFKDELIITRIL